MHPCPRTALSDTSDVYPVGASCLNLAPMHQRGITRCRERVRPRTKTRKGMRLKSKRGTCKKGLIQKIEAKPPNLKYDILVKCWTLGDDNHYIRRCCADHPEHVKSIINCSAFKTIMQGLRSQLEEQWKYTHSALVLCVDGIGRHRSVALAGILKAVYEIKGFTSMGPFLSTSVAWKGRTCSKAHCRQKQESQKIYAALADE